MRVRAPSDGGCFHIHRVGAVCLSQFEFLLRISHGVETNQRPTTGSDLGAATIARVDHQTGCQHATHLQLTIQCSGKASRYYELWLIESYDGFACSARSLSPDSSAYQHS